MILDELLFKEISPAGKSLLSKAGLKEYPKNVDEMYVFLNQVNISKNAKEFDGILISNIFYSFVSALEVRDRHTTARTFEDIFSYLFNITATDTGHRHNPDVPQEIVALNKYNTKDDDWTISDDLSGNKREKADTVIGDYSISLKTLRGIAYDNNDKVMPKTIYNDGEEINNNQNNELNVGSLSYRALLKGILPDDELKQLGDRKAGLGSGGAIRKNVLDRIIYHKKQDLFKERLNLFMNYVYDEDLYIVLKSNFKITWHLIPSKSFIDSILFTYERDESNFQKIWYRWENNNLRMNWPQIIEKLDEYKLHYKTVEINLGDAVYDESIQRFKANVENMIKKEIEMLVNKK